MMIIFVSGPVMDLLHIFLYKPNICKKLVWKQSVMQVGVIAKLRETSATKIVRVEKGTLTHVCRTHQFLF